VGTASVLLLVEPLVVSLNPKIEPQEFNANELVYSIGYKSRATFSESLIFPCEPKTFSWRTGIDFKIGNHPTKYTRSSGFDKYTFYGGYLGLEHNLNNILARLQFIFGVDMAFYHLKTVSKSRSGRWIYVDRKNYWGLTPSMGVHFIVSSKLMINSEINGLVGFRNYKRGETDSRNNNKENYTENSGIFALGMPRILNLTFFYLFNGR
jgi:hypothetical protein